MMFMQPAKMLSMFAAFVSADSLLPFSYVHCQSSFPLAQAPVRDLDYAPWLTKHVND